MRRQQHIQIGDQLARYRIEESGKDQIQRGTLPMYRYGLGGGAGLDSAAPKGDGVPGANIRMQLPVYKISTGDIP